MTSLPPNADELVSAYLDGEAAPDEIAIVEASSELMTRVEALRGIAGLVSAPLDPPGAQREAHLAAALDLFDELHADPTASDSAPGIVAMPTAADPTPAHTVPTAPTTTTGGTATGGVTSLAQARARRRPRRAGLFAAAAAALLLFMGITALNIGRSSDNSVDLADEATAAIESDAAADTETADDSAAASANLQPAEEGAARAFDAADAEPAEAEAPAADEAADAADDAAGAADADEAGSDDAAMNDEEVAEEEAAGDAAFAQEAEAPRVDAYYLGDFVLERDLADELGRLSLTDLDARLQLGDGLFPSCQQEIVELARVPTSTLVARARIDDRAVEVHQLLVESGVATLLVVDERTCEVTGEVAAPR